jgi:23S rRNA pseudouridine2605 synthase
MSESRTAPPAGDRLAKVIARSGLCSRRDAEGWIAAGRVTVNGKKVITPAFNVTERDKIAVDGQPLAVRQGTRLWLYHKPAGLVVTEKDPQGRRTVFDAVEELGLPRVVSVGRLDINTEGLLLLTNDGGLKRVLELPETGWLRRYRVRAHGSITQARLDTLQHGIEVDGIRYGEIEATLEREQGANVWLTLALREGKNREVRNVLEELGLTVNRLIRVSYGPFQLGDIPPGEIETVKARVLQDQLGRKLAEAAGVDFDSDMPEPMRSRPPQRGGHPAKTRTERGSFSGQPETRRAPRMREDDNTPPPRRIHFEGGETIVEARKSTGRGDRPERGDRPARGDRPGRVGDRPERGDRPFRGPRPEGNDRPPRGFGARGRPSRDFGEKSRTPDDGFERRPRRRDAEAGGQADARQKRPYREARADGPRPARSGFAGKGGPRSDSRGPRPDRSDRPKFNRSGSDRSGSDRPKSDRPYADRPRSDRPKSARSDAAGEGRSQRPAFGKPTRPGKPGARPPSRPGAGGPRKSGPGERPRGGPGGRPTGGRPSGGPGGRPPGGPRKPRGPKS